MKKLKLRQTLIKYLFIGLIVFAFSCESRKTTATYLTGGSQKYWTMVLEYPIKTGRGTLYNKDGTYEIFFSNEDGVRISSSRNYATKWRIQGDSILHHVGQDVKFRIEYINDDVFVLNNLNTRELIVYRTSEDQTSPIAADTVDHSKEL